MSNEKVKTESYQQFGGINEKYSPYVLGPMEFLDLRNLDFQTPGSLTARWGSTQYLSQIYPSYITSLNELSFVSGASGIMTGFQSGVYFGATTGNAQGLSFTIEGATTFLTYAFSCYYATMTTIGALIESELGGITQMIPSPYSYGQLQANISCATFTINPTAPLTSDNTLSAVMMNNYAFCADGQKFFKFDGTTTYPVGLPPVTRLASQVSLVNGGLSLANLGGCTNVYINLATSVDPYLAMGTTGMYVYYASYVNNRGFEGPIWPIRAVPYQSWITGTSLAPFTSGQTYFSSRMFIYAPAQFGIQSLNVYSWWQPNIDDATGASYKLNNDPNIWSNNSYVFNRNIALTGGTATAVDLGTSIGGMSFMWANAIGLPADPVVQSYQPLTFGLSILAPPVLPFVSLIIPGILPATNLAAANLKPRYLETYGNRLWLAGMSSLPSTVFFSDEDEPEGYNVEWQFDVIAKAGDVITGMRAYQSKLYIFKRRSLHVVVGDFPFVTQVVSDQYGAVNNRCIVVYGDLMLFLDQRGVVMFNGGGIDVLSSKKVQPTIDSINWSAAYDSACMVHDKARNQILIAIPTGQNTIPDTVLVYDYLAGAWTKYSGLNVTAMMKGLGRFKQETTFYGNYSGMINWFGTSFIADNGVGFTTYMKPRFLHDMGDSTQKQFRRLYLNTDPPAGNTLLMVTNFFQDYGTSIVKSMTIIQSSFQSRTEFGISGKALAFEMANIQTNIRLKIHGFTIESRLQRRV